MAKLVNRLKKKTLSQRLIQARLKMMRWKMRERQHRRGYEKQPLTADELNIWQNKQVWETRNCT